MTTSRRGFLHSLAGGALVYGFDVRARSWITRAVTGPNAAPIPHLDGELRTTGLDAYAADFGRIVTRQPRAVLIPGSVEDIVRILQFAREHRLHVAASGQAGTDDLRESHSQFGQALVEAGIAIDMHPLAAIGPVSGQRVEVEAGARWSDVFDAVAPAGLTPPVLTDYMHLSVGGTLSVGGIGGATQRFGVQVDNVLELEVVTGHGQRLRCSRHDHRELFDAVLAGGGQCAIITRATLALVPAETHARVYQLFYDDLGTFLIDQRILLFDGGQSYLEGQIVRRADDTGWRFMLEAALYFTPPHAPDDTAHLVGLGDNRAEAQITTLTYRDFAFRLDPTIAFLKAIGAWQLAHPWLTLFLPIYETGLFISDLVSTLTPADTGQGPILLYPFDTAKTNQPLFRTPATREAFHLSILRTAVPSSPEVIAAMLADNRALYDRAVALGGTRYLIGAIPDFSPRDWQLHFGPAWDALVRAKQRFDPDHVLTPGQGMFAG